MVAAVEEGTPVILTHCPIGRSPLWRPTQPAVPRDPAFSIGGSPVGCSSMSIKTMSPVVHPCAEVVVIVELPLAGETRDRAGAPQEESKLLLNVMNALPENPAAPRRMVLFMPAPRSVTPLGIVSVELIV